MGLRKTERSKYWLFQTKVNGKTWTRSTNQTDYKKALRDIPRLMKQAQTERDNPDAPKMLFDALKAEVKRVKEEVSESQGERIDYSFKQFKDFCGNIRLEKVTHDLLEKYQEKRLITASVSTVDRDLIYILRMLRKNGYRVDKPSRKNGTSTPQRAFTSDEYQKFFQVCPETLKPLYMLMLATGARQAELVPSDKSTHVPVLKNEVDLEKRIIKLRTAKQRQGSIKRHIKIRVIQVPEWMIEPLREQMSNTEGEFVFPSLINPARQFDRILKKAGIPKIDALGQKLTAHSFRHTYATKMAEMLGQNAFHLKEVLGHERLSTTERYVHASAPVIEIALASI